MAAYALYLGEPSGEKILNKRFRGLESDMEIAIDATEMGDLLISRDPYRDEVWSKNSLQSLQESLGTHIIKKRERAIASVKEQLRLEQLTPWALPNVERLLRNDRQWQFLQTLWSMVEKACANDGTIVYWCD